MIQVGDFVTIGKSKLTWEVCGLNPEPGWAWLRSGQSGVHSMRNISALTLFKKGTK